MCVYVIGKKNECERVQALCGGEETRVRGKCNEEKKEEEEEAKRRDGVLLGMSLRLEELEEMKDRLAGESRIVSR